MAPPTEALTVAPPAPGTDLVPAAEEHTRRKRTKQLKPPAAPKVKKQKGGPGRTTRVVLRRLDPWSVLKLSLVYYLAVFIVVLVAGVLLWSGAEAAGVVGNIENFMIDIGFDDFKFIPSELLGGVALGGLVLVVAGTCANVLLTALFNLMSDVVGGLKLTLQEDVAAAPKKTSKKDEGKSTV